MHEKLFLDDSPIKKEKDDLLGRGEFSKKIGQTILSMNVENGLCIGIFGPWGSGKTSILNMILEEVVSCESDKDATHIILTFNPWNYSSEEQLIHQFFYMLANRFASSKEVLINGIGTAIKKYAETAEKIASLTQLNLLSLVTNISETASKIASNGSILNDEDLALQREGIIDRLAKLKQKVIIVIDDIDRLPNSQIRLIFQLVNSVAKFPNTIYVLAFDRAIVANALSGIQESDGNRFLEKIVQVPIEIPAIREDSLNKILFAKLDELRKIYNFEIDRDHWPAVYKACLNGQLKTLREINRLFNTLHAKCIVSGNELNFVDLVGLTLIENKFPELYYWIRTNKGCLTRKKKYWLNVSKNSKMIIEENRKNILQLFPERGEIYCEMLNVLFPYWAQNDSVTSDMLFRWKRIGNSQFFDRYFCLQLAKDEIPRITIENVLFNMDMQELTDFLNGVNNNYSGKYFLDELRSVAEELEDDRKLLIAKALIRKAELFDDNDKARHQLFELPLFLEVQFGIQNLLRNIREENAVFRLLQDEIENANINTIRIVSHILNSIEITYSRQDEYGKSLITEEHLLCCKQCYSDKVRILAQSTDLLEVTDVRLILYLFEKFDSKGFEQYIQNELQDKLQILKILQTFVIEAVGSDGKISWAYDKGYSRFLSEEQITDAYTECLKNGRFWTLSNEMQLKIIVFDLWTMEQRNWMGYVPDELIHKRRDELKNNYNVK